MKFRRKFFSAPAFLTCVILLQTSPAALASSVNDCRGVKYAYSAKGLDQSDVPRQPRQGKQISQLMFVYYTQYLLTYLLLRQRICTGCLISVLVF